MVKNTLTMLPGQCSRNNVPREVVLWDNVPWDVVLWYNVPRDIVLWDNVPRDVVLWDDVLWDNVTGAESAIRAAYGKWSRVFVLCSSGVMGLP